MSVAGEIWISSYVWREPDALLMSLQKNKNIVSAVKLPLVCSSPSAKQQTAGDEAPRIVNYRSYMVVRYLQNQRRHLGASIYYFEVSVLYC